MYLTKDDILHIYQYIAYKINTIYTTKLGATTNLMELRKMESIITTEPLKIRIEKKHYLQDFETVSNIIEIEARTIEELDYLLDKALTAHKEL